MTGRARFHVWLSRILVRLYPADWRARHGEELAAILEERPPGPMDTLDLLHGALDAHIRSQVARARLGREGGRVPRGRVTHGVVPGLLVIMALGLNLAMVMSIVAAMASDPDAWQGWGGVALVATSVAGGAWLGRRVRAPRVAR